MRGNLTQLLILLLAIGAPALSWVFGKLREQAELKKARDAARRRHEESLRTTHLTERSPARLSPQEQRQRERQDLAARRQAQLRELRQRQHERVSRPGTVVVRGPGPTMPQRPAPRPVGPLRPGVPAPPTGRRTPPVVAPPRSAPGRRMPPVAGSAPTTPVRRPTIVPGPTARARGEEKRPEPARGGIAATEIGQGRAVEALRRPRGVGPDVRGMLIGADGRPRPRTELAKVVALAEVLSSPIALRSEDQLPWTRV